MENIQKIIKCPRCGSCNLVDYGKTFNCEN